ncbi:MAG: response regulator [Candidatus Binatia bacterium]
MEILLVEDNPGDVRLMQEVLKEGPVPTHLNVVNDGSEALAFLRQEGQYADVARPDLILLDLNLPQQEGHEVLAEVKADPTYRGIPVVVLTSSTAEQDVVKSYALHANCHLRKPMNLEEYLRLVKVLEEFWFNLAILPGRHESVH